jgi:hypothetical protein
MNENEKNDERDANLGALAEDAAHPFDQTNGIVDGLEGNADDPDQVDERLSDQTGDGNPLGVNPARNDDEGA